MDILFAEQLLQKVSQRFIVLSVVLINISKVCQNQTMQSFNFQDGVQDGRQIFKFSIICPLIYSIRIIHAKL